MSRTSVHHGAALLWALSSAACTVGPDYAPPAPTGRLAAAWRQPAGDAVTAERMDLARWWQRFGSDELSAFADQLVSQNLSLAEARQRVVAARARRGIVSADRLPQVRAGAGYTRASTGDRSLNFQGPPPGQDVDVYSVSTSAGWEIDLWGRVARNLEAADAEIDVAVEDYRDAAVSLLAELAIAYADASTLHQRLDVAGRGVALQEDTVRLVQSRLDAGSGTRLDLDQAQRELENTRALVPELQRALAAAENRIAVLLGERPRDGLVSAGAALAAPAVLGVGVPADLLARRADVRRAERRLAAATARIGAAEAERYPNISIGGTLALAARDVDTLGTGADALSYTFGPSLTIPLFTGGRIDSNVAVRSAEAEAARLTFERSLLDAIAEVETAAAGVVRTRERREHLDAAAVAARSAVVLARQLYDAGSSSLLQVLDAQRTLVATEDELLVAGQASLVQTVTLYRALGGGFEPIPLEAPHHTTTATEPER